MADAPTPSDIARKEFEVVRRGYDQQLVRGFLHEVSALVERLQRAEAELTERATKAESRLQAAEQPDEAAMLELLGEETTRVLTSAREAAADIRAKAEEAAERLIAEATAQAAQTRAGAMAEADKRLADARAEGDKLLASARGELERRSKEGEEAAARIRAEGAAEAQALREEAQRELAAAKEEAAAIVEAAKEEGRQLVADAQALREKVLRDLAARRKKARLQIEQLNAGRERLLQAYDVVRATVQEATDELQASITDARVAAAAAARRVELEPEASVDELDRELATARLVDLPVAEPPPLVKIPEGRRRREEQKAKGPDAPAPATASADAGSPSPTDEAPASEPAGAPKAEAPEAEAPEAEAPETEAPETEAPQAAVEPGAGDDPFGPIEVETRSTREARAAVTPPTLADPAAQDPADAAAPPAPAPEPVAAEPAPSEPAGAAPSPSTRTEPAPEPEPTPEAESASGPEPAPSPPTKADAVFARLQAEVASPAEEAAADTADTADEAGAEDKDGGQPASPDTVAFEERAAATEPVERDLARLLKRTLADEQNEVLDRLRRAKPASVEDLLPVVEEHTRRWAEAASTALQEASAAGARWAGGTPGHAADLADDLARTLVLPLRERVDRSFAAADGNLDDVADRVRALYREWKNQRLPELALHYVAAAYAQGVLDALPGRAEVRWAVDPIETACPDCHDNVLAGTVAKGEEFPTGHRCAPAHPGCRCLVLPASA